jgi:hypothetical protein
MKLADLKSIPREELEKFTIRLFNTNLRLQKELEKAREELSFYVTLAEGIVNYFGVKQETKN